MPKLVMLIHCSGGFDDLEWTERIQNPEDEKEGDKSKHEVAEGRHRSCREDAFPSYIRQTFKLERSYFVCAALNVYRR